jgi:non-haem Fe2+, alpha-ketoglutarate-dependent halogenase
MGINVNAIRRRYRDQGFVSRVPVMRAEAAARLLAELEALEDQVAAAGGEAWTSRKHRPWEPGSNPHEAFLRSVIWNDQVLAPVKALLGPNLLLRNCDVFVKKGASERGIDWHTDTGHLGRSTDGMLTLWLALTPSTRHNGAMQFVKGSHRGAADRPARDNKHLNLTEQEIAAIDPSDVATNVMEPGEASLHHFGLVHRSGPNQTERRRVAVVMRFMAPWVSRWGSECGRATLVSGTDTHNKYSLEDRFPVTWTVQ